MNVGDSEKTKRSIVGDVSTADWSCSENDCVGENIFICGCGWGGGEVMLVTLVRTGGLRLDRVRRGRVRFRKVDMDVCMWYFDRAET